MLKLYYYGLWISAIAWKFQKTWKTFMSIYVACPCPIYQDIVPDKKKLKKAITKAASEVTVKNLVCEKT